MRFLAMSKRCAGASDAIVAAHADTEALQAFRLMRSNVFEQMYFSPDWRGAVLVVQAESQEAARRQLATLPLVAHGVIEFDVWTLDNYDHYVRLFKDEHRASL